MTVNRLQIAFGGLHTCTCINKESGSEASSLATHLVLHCHYHEIIKLQRKQKVLLEPTVVHKFLAWGVALFAGFTPLGVLTFSMAVEFSFMIEAWASCANTPLRDFLVKTFVGRKSSWTQRLSNI